MLLRPEMPTSIAPPAVFFANRTAEGESDYKDSDSDRNIQSDEDKDDLQIDTFLGTQTAVHLHDQKVAEDKEDANYPMPDYKVEEIPKLLDYDVFGFNVEQTILNINFPAACNAILPGLTNALAKRFKGYPRQMQFEGEVDLQPMHDKVWDIKNGLILTLGEDTLVTEALKGFRKLSQEEIE